MVENKRRILVLCTGNSCRSQMAEGFLNQYDGIEAFSAGTEPADRVNPLAVEVMKETGIDLSRQKPEHVREYLSQTFDIVLTVCDSANETCPVFSGKVGTRLHHSFEDPAGHPIEFFRKIRDLIRQFVSELVSTERLEGRNDR